MLPRMASITCTRSDVFPNTTVVKAYPRVGFHSGQEGVPAGVVQGEATMTSGTLTIEGLVAGQEYTLAAEVAGKWAYLGVQAPESTAVIASTGATEPSLDSLLAWSADPVNASGSFILTTAGTLYKVRIPLKENFKFTNVLLWLVTKGATLTANQCFMGLFAEGTRKLLGKVSAAETIAKWEAANGTLLTVPLEVPVSNVGPGYVDLGMFFNGTTAPTFAAAPAQSVTNAANLVNAGSSGKGLRFASADTGLTTALPATMSETQAAVAAPVWVGLS